MHKHEIVSYQRLMRLCKKDKLLTQALFEASENNNARYVIGRIQFIGVTQYAKSLMTPHHDDRIYFRL